MKYILHIDTSSDIGMIALAGDGQLICYKSNIDTRNQAATINIMINEVLNEANITLTEICAIAVCGGPGSYTGLRIGMATAKGLCYALDKPLIADNRLTLLAYSAYYANKELYDVYAAILIAREKEYFITVHDNTFKCIVEPKHIDADTLAGVLHDYTAVCLIGNMSEDAISILNINNLNIINIKNIEPAIWAKWTLEQYNCNNTVNLALVEPFYLKEVYTHK